MARSIARRTSGRLAGVITLLGLAVVLAGMAGTGPSAAQAQSMQCGDFATQSEAQTAFRADPGALRHLDPDGNGIICQDLPCPCDRVPPIGWPESRQQRSAQATAISVPVSGTGTATDPVDGTSERVTFEGTLAVRRFMARGDQVFAVGMLSGDFRDASGTTPASVVAEPVSVTVQRLEASCEALRVMLGPLAVDVAPLAGGAGLWQGDVVQTDLDELAIAFAVDQDGGDLARIVLCAVADLTGGSVDLDGGSALPLPASELAGLLNRVVRMLS